MNGGYHVVPVRKDLILCFVSSCRGGGRGAQLEPFYMELLLLLGIFFLKD